MKITPIKTHKITTKDKDLLKILDTYLPKKLLQGSVVAVTSKIVAICEGQTASLSENKNNLIKKESELYLSPQENRYGVSLTIAKNILSANAGIDESNANGCYVLWPKNPQKSANSIRSYLKNRYGARNIGVVITDSKTVPLRWGVTGVALAFSGFKPLKNYIGTKDLFGRKFEFEKLHIADSLATAACVVMGEGAEQTPISIIEDVSFVNFVDRNPTKKELDQLKISIQDDLYAPLLKSAKWKRGKA